MGCLVAIEEHKAQETRVTDTTKMVQIPELCNLRQTHAPVCPRQLPGHEHSFQIVRGLPGLFPLC